MSTAANMPVRTCVGCGARDAQASMLRLRLGEDGRVVRVGGVPAGRSAYVHERTGCIMGLVRSKGLGRSLRTTIAKDERVELSERLKAEIVAGDRRTMSMRNTQSERTGA